MKKSIKVTCVTLMMLICMFAFSAVTFASSKVVGSGSVTDTIDWSLTEDGVLTISGTGKIPSMVVSDDVDYMDEEFLWPWKEWYDTTYDDHPASTFIKKVVIGEGITGIGQSCFENLISLTEVKLPESLESIHWYAFTHCRSLKKVVFPEGVQYDEWNRFGDSPLENVTLSTWFFRYDSIDYSSWFPKMKVAKLPAVTSVKWLSSQAEHPLKKLTDIYYPGSPESWKNVKYSNYISSSVTIHYYYNSTKFSNCTASIALNSYSYTGKEVKPTVTVKTAAGTVLKKGTNYTVSYKNNVECGTATITVTPIGKYSGPAKTLTFEIKPSFDNCTASTAYTSYSYTGKEVKPVVTVKTASGTKLKKDVNYTLSYENNVKCGTATITVTPIGKYSGQAKTLTFNIKPAKVKNLKITKSTGTEDTIEWDLSPEVTEYKIYNKTLHREIGRTKSNTYTITGLKASNQYDIVVYAIVEQTDETTGEVVEYQGFANSVRIHS